MSRYNIIITLIFIVAAGGIYIGYRGIPFSRTQTITQFHLPTPQSSIPTTHGFPLVPTQQNAKLIDLQGIASGEATLEHLNTLYLFKIRAEHLPQPPKKSFYAAWFIDGPNASFAGRLEKITSGRYKDDYLLQFASRQQLSSAKKILVTLEKVDDAYPEKPILMGSFAN